MNPLLAYALAPVNLPGCSIPRDSGKTTWEPTSSSTSTATPYLHDEISSHCNTLSGKVLTSSPAFIRSSCCGCRRVSGREQKKLKRGGTLFSPASCSKIYYVVVVSEQFLSANDWAWLFGKGRTHLAGRQGCVRVPLVDSAASLWWTHWAWLLWKGLGRGAGGGPRPKMGTWKRVPFLRAACRPLLCTSRYESKAWLLTTYNT